MKKVSHLGPLLGRTLSMRNVNLFMASFEKKHNFLDACEANGKADRRFDCNFRQLLPYARNFLVQSPSKEENTNIQIFSHHLARQIGQSPTPTWDKNDGNVLIEEMGQKN